MDWRDDARKARRTAKGLAALLALALVLPTGLLAACSAGPDDTPPVYDETPADRIPVLAAGLVAENETLALDWDPAADCIVLTDKTSGRKWGSIPYDAYTTPGFSIDDNYQLSSALSLLYIEPINQQVKQVTSYYGARLKGRIRSEKIADGLRITFYFDLLRISIPVDCTLTPRGLSVSVDVAGIVEAGGNRILQLDLMPFLASAMNDTDSYLFVPTGSGMLLDTVSYGRLPRQFSDEIYGEDPTVTTDLRSERREPIRLPVFGVRDRDAALLGIITEGDDSAWIGARAGDMYFGFSNVYAGFRLRGQDFVKIPDLWGTKMAVPKYSTKPSTLPRFTVEYRVLSGYSQDYAGMAAAYRDDLLEREGLTRRQDDAPLALRFFGAAEARRFLLGIPYETLRPLTTFAQCAELLGQAEERTGTAPVVQLRGFTRKGLEVGRIGGGFAFSRKLGGIDGYRALAAYCADKGQPLYADYDLIRFREGGNGFHPLLDSAKTASSATAYQYFHSVATLDALDTAYRFGLLARDRLPDAGRALLERTRADGIAAVGLSTLSSLSYSDYAASDFFQKNGMGDAAQAILRSLSDAGIGTAADAANAYAAVLADRILSAPVGSGDSDAADQDVPFYEMVFKGYVPMTGPPINLARSPEETFLRCVETGIGLLFTLCASDPAEFARSVHPELAGSDPAGVLPLAEAMIRRSKAAYEATAGATIVSRTALAEGVYRTDFSNGASILVNYTDQAASTDAGEIGPMDFRLRTGTEGAG